MKENKIKWVKNIKLIVPVCVITVIIVAGTIIGIINHNNADNKATKTEIKENTSSSVTKDEIQKEIDKEKNKITKNETEDESVVDSNKNKNENTQTEDTTSSSGTSSSSTTNKPKPQGQNNSSTNPTVNVPTNQAHPLPDANTVVSSGKWVCPNPAAHGSEDGAFCYSAEDHQQMIAEYKAAKEWVEQYNKEHPIPEGYTAATWCSRCNRPFGNGYNGTCLGYFCGGSFKCHHYDTKDTCQINHNIS